MVKYKEYFQKMLEENKETFDSFAKLHMDYSFNQDELQEKFNEEGTKIMDIVRDYENRLCANTERGMYNKYSAGLSEKFHEILKSHFPLVDHIGLIVEKSSPDTLESVYIPEIKSAFEAVMEPAYEKPQEPVFEELFTIKKINL